MNLSTDQRIKSMTSDYLCELYEYKSNCYVSQCRALLWPDNDPMAQLAWTCWISLCRKGPCWWSNSQFAVWQIVGANFALAERLNWKLVQPQQSMELRLMWRSSIVDGLNLLHCWRRMESSLTLEWDLSYAGAQLVHTSKYHVSQRQAWGSSGGADRYWFYRLSERRPPPVECHNARESEKQWKFSLARSSSMSRRRRSGKCENAKNIKKMCVGLFCLLSL